MVSRRHLLLLTAIGLAACRQEAGPAGLPPDPLPRQPWVIAHRGAAAYAPENTVPALVLGAGQRADYVEFDLQRTKDGHLVVLHDLTLDRTTDVARLFPDRARPAPDDADRTPHWWLDDFTLEELRTLDAGTWFSAAFAGTRIPTFDEVIAAVRGRTGLFIELKSPERYPGIEAETVAVLARHGLHQSGADVATPVVIQSFSAPAIERLASMGTGLPLHLLFGAAEADEWLSDQGLRSLGRFATGVSPEKVTLATHAGGWKRAIEFGLPITPWTFRASTVDGYDTVTAEMEHFLASGAAGLITDNPDLAPGD